MVRPWGLTPVAQVNMKQRWNKIDWYILGALLLLALLAWWRVLFLKQWSFGIETDFIRQFYPARVYEVNSLASGTFPLWNPYVLSGQPFFASYQTALLYPPNLMMVGGYALAGAAWTLKAQCFFVVLHLYLAGVFMYLLARDLDAGRAGSAIAAITFMFSGFMVAHAGHLNQVSSAAWMPLVFFLFNRSLTRRSVPYAVWAGVATAVALLAGHVQSVFYLCALLAGLVVLRAWQHHRSEPDTSSIFFGVGALALMVGIGGGLAAIQLLPTYELIGLSTRTRIPYSMAQTSSLPRYQVVNLLFPKFFGTEPNNYYGGWLMWETYGYAGIVSGVLAVVALLRRKRAFVVFLWIALLLSLVLALGPGGYLFTLLFKMGIFVNRFHDPARTLVVFAFATALLAGLGADHIVRNCSEKYGRRYSSAVKLVGLLTALLLLLVAALSVFLLSRKGRAVENSLGFKAMILPAVLVLALLCLLLLVRKLKVDPAVLAIWLVLLVAVDLLVMNVPWVTIEINPKDIYNDAVASRYVAAQPGVFRVETDAFTMYKSLDNGALYDLQKASGDDSLVLKDYFDYREIIFPQVGPGVQLSLFYEGAVNSPMLDTLNDVYFMSRRPLHPKLLAEGKLVLQRYIGGIYVYRNKTALPRAWMSDAEAFSNNRLVYDRLLATRGKGIRDTALVVMPEVAERSGEGAPVPAVKGKVKVSKYSAQHIVLETDPSSKGLLVTSELYYPGWQAYIDGKKATTYKTDLMLRGVMLPGGQHSVEFRFSPGRMKAGAVISLGVLALLLLYLGAWLFRRSRTRKREKSEAVSPDTGP
jgi:hypothetical protein